MPNKSEYGGSQNDYSGDSFSGDKEGKDNFGNDISKQSNSDKSNSKDVSFSQDDAAMAALGAMQAAASQLDETFGPLEAAPQTQLTPSEVSADDVDNMLASLKAAAAPLAAEINAPPEFTGVQKVLEKIFEGLTPFTVEKTKTGIDFGINVDDIIGIPGAGLVEAITGKSITGMIKDAITGDSNNQSSQPAKSTTKSSSTSFSGDNKQSFGNKEGHQTNDSTKNVFANNKEGISNPILAEFFSKHPELAARFPQFAGGETGASNKKNKPTNLVDEVRLKMEEALQQQLEAKMFEMPEFQLLSQIGGNNGLVE